MFEEIKADSVWVPNPNFTESFTDLFGSNARVTSLEKAKKVLFWEIL